MKFAKPSSATCMLAVLAVLATNCGARIVDPDAHVDADATVDGDAGAGCRPPWYRDREGRCICGRDSYTAAACDPGEYCCVGSSGEEVTYSCSRRLLDTRACRAP